jgi:hypothetical protein
MRAYQLGDGYPVQRIGTTDLLVFVLKGQRELRRELVELFQEQAQERSHFCVYCGVSFIWDAKCPYAHFAKRCSFEHVDDIRAESLRAQSKAGHDALRIANGSKNPRDHLTQATAHITVKLGETHASVELMRNESTRQASVTQGKLDSLLAQVASRDPPPPAEETLLCPICYDEYRVGDFMHCTEDDMHRVCVGACAPNSREGLIEKSGQCVYPGCTGSMQIRGGSSAELITWWVAVQQSIHEKVVIASEATHQAFLSQLPVAEKIFHDSVTLLSLSCPGSHCGAPAVLDSGCAAMTCSRCELEYCAACLYVMPPGTMDWAHTGERVCLYAVTCAAADDRKFMEKTLIHDHCRDEHLRGSVDFPDRSYFLHKWYIEEVSRPHYLRKMVAYLAQYSGAACQQGLGVCVQKGVITPREAAGLGWTDVILISDGDDQDSSQDSCQDFDQDSDQDSYQDSDQDPGQDPGDQAPGDQAPGDQAS